MCNEGKKIFQLDKSARRIIMKIERDAAQTAGGRPHHPKGGETMRITLHIGRFTVTIIVKSRNRHSAK